MQAPSEQQVLACVQPWLTAGVQLWQSGWPLNTLHIMTAQQQRQEQQQEEGAPQEHRQQQQGGQREEASPAPSAVTNSDLPWKAVDNSGVWEQLWEVAWQQDSNGSSSVMQQCSVADTSSNSSRAWVQLVLVRPDGHVAWRHQEAALQQTDAHGTRICQLRTVLRQLHQGPEPPAAAA